MENCADAAGIAKRFSIDLYGIGNSLRLRLSAFLPDSLLDRVLFLVEAVVAYGFGIYMGFVIGWLLGLYSGNVYVGHFEPVYMDDLSQLSHWRLMPYDFAGAGATIGVVVGVIAISLINSRLLSRRVASLYEKDVTEPEDIARLFGKSKRQIQRVINKLTKKEKNRKKIYSQKDYQAQGPIPLGPVVDMYEVLYKLKKIS